MRNEDEGRDRSTVVINRLRETCKNVTAGGAAKCKHIRRDVTSKKSDSFLDFISRKHL